MSKVSGAALAKAGYIYLGTPYSAMDCQAFVEKSLMACGIKMNLKGSNAWYRKILAEGWAGTPEECRKKFGYIPAGAFLFIWDDDGGEVQRGYHDGLGNASHIGIYTGTRQGALHSSQSKGCVAESRFSGKTINGGWNRVGLWKNINYDIKTNQIISGAGSGSGKSETSGGGTKMDKKAIVVLPSDKSGSTVNMRADKTEKNGKPTADVIERVPVGSFITILQDVGEWCQISYGGKTGWMLSDYIEYGTQSDETDAMDGSNVQSIIDKALRVLENALVTASEQVEIIGSANGRG